MREIPTELYSYPQNLNRNCFFCKFLSVYELSQHTLLVGEQNWEISKKI